MIYLMIPLLLHLDLPSSLFPSGLHTKVPYAFLISFKRTTGPGYLLFQIISLIISGDEFTSRAVPYEVFSRLLLFFRRSEQTDPAAPCSRHIPTVYTSLNVKSSCFTPV